MENMALTTTKQSIFATTHFIVNHLMQKAAHNAIDATASTATFAAKTISTGVISAGSWIITCAASYAVAGVGSGIYNLGSWTAHKIWGSDTQKQEEKKPEFINLEDEHALDA